MLLTKLSTCLQIVKELFLENSQNVTVPQKNENSDYFGLSLIQLQHFTKDECVKQRDLT